MKLSLSQPGAAARMGVDAWTVLNWEKGRTEPPVKAYPAIIRFLGYDPLPTPKTLRDRLLAKRRTKGWSITEAASAAGVDQSTWGTWERTGGVAWPRYQELLDRFLEED